MFRYYTLIDMWQEKEAKSGKIKRIKPVIQIVIWLGKGNPPPSEYKTKTTVHRYFVVDMKNVPPDVFLKSTNPYEVILALVSGKSPGKALPQVISKLSKILKTKKELLRFIEEIEILAKLFDFGLNFDMIKEKIDIRETNLFKIGEKEGLQKAILIAVEVKFGKDKAELIKKKVEKIENIRKLESLHKKVIKAEKWSEVQKIFEQNSK